MTNHSLVFRKLTNHSLGHEEKLATTERWKSKISEDRNSEDDISEYSDDEENDRFVDEKIRLLNQLEVVKRRQEQRLKDEIIEANKKHQLALERYLSSDHMEPVEIILIH